MLKIALNAGHYMKTAGKRCLKKLDKNETREWWLNDRICDKIEQKLKAYDGYQLLRVDDTTGATDVSLANRAKKANTWGADFYLSIHHNAGINGGYGGGVVAYTYTNVDAKTLAWQKKLYDAIIKHTGLKGNRSTPLAKSNLAECRQTAMPAVLLECGFMDSATDVPIILTDNFADKVATACVEVIVAQGKLSKKVIKEEPVSAKIYKVQIGAYSKKANAEAMVKKLKADGYDAIIV
jgi:N-acetylmuramoyl-L-alanine amidase